jgi:tRNA G18 (ribose-2'-O)-methylase SpoU
MERPKAYLFLHNIAKKNNFGTILRSAAAFNFDTVFYVSSRPDSKKQRVLDSFSFHGNKGTLSKMQFVAFPSVAAAKVYFRENNLTVCGV